MVGRRGGLHRAGRRRGGSPPRRLRSRRTIEIQIDVEGGIHWRLAVEVLAVESRVEPRAYVSAVARTAAESRALRRRTAFVWSCDTRDSVTPSTSPISRSVELLVVVERHDELLALREPRDRLGERLVELALLERELGIGALRCPRSCRSARPGRCRPAGSRARRARPSTTGRCRPGFARAPPR